MCMRLYAAARLFYMLLLRKTPSPGCPERNLINKMEKRRQV